MVNTLTATGFILTQGFQQPTVIPPSVVINSPLYGANFTSYNNEWIEYTVSDFNVAAGTGRTYTYL